MIITTIANNKLFVQFDKLVKNGLIKIKNDDKTLSKKHNINYSEFEIIDLPENISNIHLEIIIEGEDPIIKSIAVNSTNQK